MKKKATEMVCILDRSGSMYKKRKDTIGSFNQMLEKQKGSLGRRTLRQHFSVISVMSSIAIRRSGKQKN